MMENNNKNQLVERLQSILQDTVECYENLKKTIDHEKDDIVSNKGKNLPDLMAQKENITDKLKILSDARQRTTEEIARAFEVSKMGLTITKIVSLLPFDLGSKLDELKNKLKDLVKEVDFANTIISRLVDSSKKFVNDRLNIIRNVKPVTTYSNRGRLQEYSLRQGNMLSYAV
ncbi:MAG: flagellar protein FlgN [Nitrospinae bacterium]|nr:flagellar protein FlgN [Nitrospinota bacterium]